MGSSILESILADIKEAMKSKDNETLVTLRTLHSEIKNIEINTRKKIRDEDIASVLAKGIKQRQDAAEQFEKAGRMDLVDIEQKQIALYTRYQPKQLNRSEIEEIAVKVIAETGAETKKDMGKVMSGLMPLVKGKADGKLVNEIVNTKLG